ncbi:zinc ABC transporter substrate-binding protein [Leucobacter sp. cx-328]|uniref:metal ABC transporter substrate-binding protein n=1 Tax=unclassified Leucobacter TaxID=2621730 RepID=UPI00165E9027|nr:MULTISPECIES: metal ABC transporter substrate-binding protein [unclassified Leucobacter]MBC9943518.1 zinc ABC transporter substrate-binding protein [Leucobacter sp. cx-328]
MRHHSLTKRAQMLGATGIALAATLLLTSCGTNAADAEHDKLKVVATTTQLTDFATQVGGDDTEVTGLLPAGGSAHHFDPTPADLLALGQADVLVVNGANLESFVDSAVEASGFSGVIITAADGIDLAEAKQITAEGEDEASGTAAAADAVAHDHDHDHADEHDHDHGDEANHDHAEHADEVASETANDHDGHDHGDTNPHLWTAPRYAEGMVSEIADGFAQADPEHAANYTKRGEEYIATLTELDRWAAEQFAAVPEADRVLVSGHDSLRYFLHDYEIGFAGAILPSFEDNAEPSAAQIDALVEQIHARGVKAIFVESSMSPKLAKTIAREANVTVVDDTALYADSLGSAGSGAESYVGATVHNTRAIIEAWGGSVTDPPAAVDAAMEG